MNPASPSHAGRADWSRLPPPAAGLRGVVVMPARNESALIARALRALAGQGGDVTGDFEVLVLANNCSDDTAAQARKVASSCRRCAIHVVEVELPAPLANVGIARRELMDEACRRLGLARQPNGAILSTDADTRVDAQWVAATLAALDSGADSVGGRIKTDSCPTAPAGIVRTQHLDAVYQLLRSKLESLVDPDPADPWPRHHQHFGASLAVSVEAYRRVGGQPIVPYLEDEALVRALRREDLAVRHCPKVRVWTSGRLDGRAEVGLSWQLREWAGGVTARRLPVVAQPAVEVRGWALRRRARLAWRSRNRPDAPAGPPESPGPLEPLKSLAADLGLGARWVARQLDTAQPFGRLWEQIEQARAAQARVEAVTLPLDLAVRELRARVRSYRPGAR